jgi:Domain of unknown function (DUF6468)
VSSGIGLVIESLVAVLLMLTIGYCILLNRRLRALKADEQSLKATISELITATEIAERAIGGLKLTVRDCDQNLGERLRTAERFSADLAAQLDAGEKILDRISQIALAARPSEVASSAAVPPAAPQASTSDVRAMAAAAQALAVRARLRSGGLAA